ncbi:MAG: tandem-95 repeat protein [Acidobacteriia bacterium]|nr:tandem-95 repeat protein [Terriglobia bacterium]
MIVCSAGTDQAENRWTPGPSMLQSRSGSCLAAIPDGRILITGGADAAGPLASVEVFGASPDMPGIRSMLYPRQGHVCAALPDGTVLVAGGRISNGGLTNAAEVYDAASGAWTPVGSMHAARSEATATVLHDGRVLIAGGNIPGAVGNTLELYDPATRTFTWVASPMTSPRVGHAAAALQDGHVLIAGGSDGSSVLDTVDVFDPAAGTISPGVRLSVPRAGLSASTLLDGNVLFAGGFDGSRDLATAEVFDVRSGSFGKTVPMLGARRDHIAISLPKNNTILFVGGSAAGTALATAELYVPWLQKFQGAGPLRIGRLAAAAAVLKTPGTVVVLGGRSLAGATSSSEAYSYATLTSDKPDYHPGETVTLMGSGWLPGETVQIGISVDPKTHEDVALTAVADQDGNFTNSDYQAQLSDAGVTFYVTSTGLTSGRTAALLTFTDSSGDGTITVTPNSVAAGQTGLSLTFTFTTNVAFTSSSRVRITVPTGWTAPSTSNVRVTNSNCTSATLTSATLMVITVGITCPANSGFTVTYGVTGSFVTAPATAQNAAFTTTTRLGAFGSDTTVAASPVVAVMGSASRLGFTTQPGGGTAATAWAQQPVVTVQDSAGHTITGAANAITLAIGTNPGAGTLVCTGNPLNASSGIAGFAGCSIAKAGTGYTLTASAAGLTGATSSTFNITPGAATQLIFSQQPNGGTGGTAWTAQPRLTVLDANGNTVNNQVFSIALGIGTNPSSGALSCTANPLNTASGIATFAGCKIDMAGTGYTLQATSASLPTATSAAFNIAVGPASRLSFTTQPSGGTAAVAWASQPVVAIQDAGGNAVTSTNRTITLAISNNPGAGTLTCPPGGLAVATVSGVASFAGCSINKSGTAYTLSATSSGTGISSATSSGFTIVAGAATQLVFTVQPGNGTGGSSLPTQPVVAIQDGNGNTVTTDTSSVSLAISTNPGGGTLTCTANPKAAVAGLAAFAGCKIDKVGTGYRLQATDGSLTAATSNTFNITFGTAVQLAFNTQPGGGTGGTAWPIQPAVVVQDAGGNTVTNNTSSVTLAIGTNPGGGALTCTSNPKSAVAGVATFASCNIDKVGTGYILRATDGSLAAASSTAFNITLGPAARLGFTTQPGGGTAAIAWASQPVVAIQDAGGNAVTTTDRTITLAIASNPGAGTLTCPPGSLAVATVSGVASFAGCRINKSGTGYTLSATSSGTGISAATSAGFSITAGAAAQLVFTVQPGNGTGGSSLPTQPVVAIQDANGNTVTTDTSNVTLAIGTNPGGGTLTCTANPKAAVAGLAAFAGCKIDKIGTGYTLRATDGTLTAATSNAFNITMGAAAQLAFTTQPGGGTGGTAWLTQPVVVIQDAGGNTVTNNTSSVTLAIGTNPGGGALTCTLNPKSAVAGVATFAGCNIDKAGTAYTLRATDGSLTAATSAAFNIAVGAPAKLAFSTQPGGGMALVPWSTQPVVQIQDAGGNVVTSNTSSVTLAISTNPGGGVLTCTANPKAAAAGAAAFAGCWIEKAGAGYRLQATDGSLTPATSSSFTIVPGVPARLAFNTPLAGGTGGTAWGTQPVVAVLDGGGNVVTSDTSSVTLTISANPGGGTLTCTANPQQVSTGVAAFAGCKINKVGVGYTLQAADGPLAAATSNPFNIAPGPPAQLAFVTQPGGGTAGVAWATQPVITVLDAGGNTVVTDTSNVTLTIGANLGGGALVCTANPQAATAGVATFAGCRIDKPGMGYMLQANDGALTAASSAAFTILLGPAAQPEPLVAVHVSELTMALETVAAGPATPSGDGTTGYEWWTPWWHYFVMSESVKEALRSDGTPFVVVSDADISAGRLLTTGGAPRYPIVISLASEAIRDDETPALRNYVSAGGFLLAGSAAFTRNPNGTTRGDFALANEMGLHALSSSLQNWQQTATFTKQADHRLVSDIPSGTLSWMMPLTNDDIPLGVSLFHAPEPNHYMWAARNGGATVIANGDGGVPYLATKAYGQGYFIYHAAMQPLIGDGGYDSGMYAYSIFRRAIEWAFEARSMPIVKLSPWPYAYNAAYAVRHDFENYQDQIKAIEASAQVENSLGAKGDYYFCTGTLRVEMGNSASTVASLQRAVSLYGATIGSHNGGLKNPNNPDLVVSDYDYWHWGPDEALDAQPAGYASGKDYASASIAASFADLDRWLGGLNTNRRSWVSPYFNGTREGSYELLDQLGIVSAGEQKLSPFPHWTISTQTQGKRFHFVTLPPSDWYIGSDVAQAMNFGHTVPTIDALVDHYYDLGALINLYSHEPSTTGTGYEYILHSSAKPAVWSVNATTVAAWWAKRSPVQVSPTYSTVGNRLVVTAAISGATDADTAIELAIPSPNWALASGGIQVKVNGTFADPNNYRIYKQGIKMRVGATASSVEVSYPLTAGPTAQNDSYGVDAGSSITVHAPGVLSNDASGGFGSLTALLAASPSHGAVSLNADGSFTYTPQAGFSGNDSFSYVAASGTYQSGLATVNIVVNQVGTVFSDAFSGPPGADPLWTTVLGSWSVANGAMTGSSPAGTYGFASGNGSWTDYSVQARIQFPAGAYGGGIGGRVNVATGAHYGVWVYPDRSTVAVVKFRSWTTFSGTFMTQVTVPYVGTTWHTLLASFQGNRIRVSLDGVQVIDITDNGFDSLPVYASGGVSLDMWTSSTPYALSFDDIVVTGLSEAPFAQDDGYSVAQGATLNVAAPGVLSNDNSGSGSALTAILASPPNHGSVSLQSDGSFSYTPAVGFTGPDSFGYQASTGSVWSNRATVTVTVTPLGVGALTLNPPVIVGGGLSQATVTLSGPAPAGGSVVSLLSGNPAVAAVPASVIVPQGSTSAPFTIVTSAAAALLQVAITASSGSTSQTASLTVAAAGSQLLFSDSFSGQPGADPLWTTALGSWNVVNGVMNGTGPVNDYGVTAAAGSWRDYFVQGRIQFPAGAYAGGIGGRVSSANGARYAVWVYPESAPGGSTLKVMKFSTWNIWGGTPMAQASLPGVGTAWHTLLALFQGNRIQVSLDGVQFIDVMDNGFDSQPAYSTGGISLDMSSYNMGAPYVFSVDDIWVMTLPSAPAAQNDAYTMSQDTALNVAAPGVLGNDTGGPGLTAILLGQPGHGTVSLQSNGSFVYTPAAGFSGIDTFTYQASAAGVLSNTAAVTITVLSLGVSSVTLNPSILTGGSPSQGAILLTGPAPGSGTVVSLQSSNPAVAAVPPGVTVPAGSTTASFTVITTAVAALSRVTITASYGSSSQNATLTLYPVGSQALFIDDFSGPAGPDPSWTTAQGSWSVANGVMNGTSSGTGPADNYGFAYANGSWTDYSLQARLQFPAGAFGGGIGGRVNPATGAHYGVWIYPESSPGGSAVVKLVKFWTWTSWGGTPMAQATLPGMGTDWHTLAAVFQGNRIQVSCDGVQVLDVTDSGFDSQPAYSSGGISLDLSSYGMSAPYMLHVDDILVMASAPAAQNDAYSVLQGATLTVAAPGLLSNDTGAGLTAALVSQPAHGALTLSADGSFTYTPTAGFSGADSFTYQAAAAGVMSNTATVTITVTPLGVSSLTLNPPSVSGGFSSQATVALNGVASTDTVVSLLSGAPSVVVVPSSVTVLAGNASAAFTVTTNVVAASTQVTLTASYGNSNQNAVLTVLPPGLQVLFSDDFSGPAGADPLWTTALGSWNIANGAMNGSGPAWNYGVAYAGGNWTDYSVQARIQFPAGAYGGGIGGRVNAATGARYAVWIYPDSSALKLIKFQGWTTWSYIPMAEVALSSVGTASHAVVVTFVGNRIQVSYDGVQVLDVTDTGFDSLAPYASGGISLDMWTGGTVYPLSVDDIVVQTTS